MGHSKPSLPRAHSEPHTGSRNPKWVALPGLLASHAPWGSHITAPALSAPCTIVTELLFALATEVLEQLVLLLRRTHQGSVGLCGGCGRASARGRVPLPATATATFLPRSQDREVVAWVGGFVSQWGHSGRKAL